MSVEPPYSGDIGGKYTSFKVSARNVGPDGWHVGEYVGLKEWLYGHTKFASYAQRLGKVISINGSGEYRSVVVEHPYEDLPPQPFPEYEVSHRPPPHGGRYAR